MKQEPVEILTRMTVSKALAEQELLKSAGYQVVETWGPTKDVAGSVRYGSAFANKRLIHQHPVRYEFYCQKSRTYAIRTAQA